MELGIRADFRKNNRRLIPVASKTHLLMSGPKAECPIGAHLDRVPMGHSVFDPDITSSNLELVLDGYNGTGRDGQEASCQSRNAWPYS